MFTHSTKWLKEHNSEEVANQMFSLKNYVDTTF